MWDLAARRPALVLVAAVAATVLAGLGAVQVKPQTDFVDTVPRDARVAAYQDLVERLDGVRFVAIYMPRADGAPSLRGDSFDALVTEQGALTAWLDARFPGAFSHTLSAWEAMRSGNYMLEKMATAGHPRSEAYAFPDDPARYEAVKRQVLQDDTLDDVLAADGSSAIIMAFFQTRDNLEARRLSGEVAAALPAWSEARGDDAPTGTPEASGLLVASDYTDDRNRTDLQTFGWWALGGVALALLWVVRRPAHVLLSLVGVSCATLWTFGAMGWAGLSVDFLTIFLAPVVIGIGVDHAVHLLHRVEEPAGGDADAGTPGPGRRAAVSFALRTTGPAMTVAGATTVAGLGAVAFVPNPMFAQIAAVSAVGVAFALVAALTLVPAVAVLLPGRARARRDAVGPWLAAWASAVHRRPALAVALVLGLTAVAAVGASQVRIESGSSENEFPQDDPLIQLQHRIESEYGAFQRGYIVVRGDMTDPAALYALLAFSERAQALPLHREASSVADLLLADEATDDGAVDVLASVLLEEAGQAPARQARLPATQEEARQRLDRLFADPLWRSIAPFTITRDYSMAVLAVRVDPWQDQEALRDLRDAMVVMEQEMQAELPQHEVHAAGAPINRAAIVDQTPINVAVATLGAALAVCAVMAIAWRRRGLAGLRVASLGLVIVVLASVWLLATIPVLDWAYRVTGTSNSASLTDMFLLAFAITVAVGIDDLVHLAARYWEARDAGQGTEAALRTSFAHAGRAVTGTSLTTFVAFTALSGVYFLQSKNLAVLTAAGVVYAYAATFLLAPWALAGRSRP